MSQNKRLDDDFEDVHRTHRGIFGAAETRQDAIKTHLKREGIEYEFFCHGCGRRTQLLVEWPEFVAMKYGLDPAAAFMNRRGILAHKPMSWVFSAEEGRWRPMAKCAGICKFMFLIRLTPDEPERQLKRGRHAQYINSAAEAQISQLCDVLRGGGPRR